MWAGRLSPGRGRRPTAARLHQRWPAQRHAEERALHDQQAERSDIMGVRPDIFGRIQTVPGRASARLSAEQLAANCFRMDDDGLC